MKEFVTIEKEEYDEIIEKKSKFIGTIIPIKSVEDAESKIKEIKKKYYDARHNCFAYRIIENGSIVERSSDDGEPSGTAGAPMLNIIKQKNLCNVLIVVTRYFGGILLGTGGLVRAYSQATENAIKKSTPVKKVKGLEVEIVTEYKELEKIRYFCRIRDINIIDIKYNENVIINLELKEEDKGLLEDNKNFNFNIKKFKVIKERYIVSIV